MKMKNNKEMFAISVAEVDKGINHQMLTDCETYGMAHGCDTDCPVLRAGECVLQDTENKELWEIIQKEITWE